MSEVIDYSAPDFDHLLPTVRHAAALPEAERINLIRTDRWIGYPHAREALDRLAELMNWPPKARMPNLLLIGSTNNGKTKIINRFLETTLPKIPLEDVVVTPVVKVEMPPNPGLPQVYSAILSELNVPHRKAARIEPLQSQAIDALKQVQTRLLIIDEVHNLLNATPVAQRQVLALLKFLGNRLQIPLVAVGTEEAWNAIRTDPQLANRFDTFTLPLWTEGTTLLQLLVSFGQMLPLRKRSLLADPSIARQVIALTDGSIGGVTRLMEMAAIQAIRRGIERITVEMITSCGFQSPEEKRLTVELAISPYN